MAIRSLFLLLFFISTPVFAEPSQYNIVATYDDKTHHIEGLEEITFSNNSPEAVSEVYLFLYPNLYRNKHPDLGNNFYRKAYPVAFNPGGTDILFIKDAQGITMPFFPQPYHSSIIIKVVFPSPIPPFEQSHLSVKFRTKIPQKWGPFGYFDDLVALQGGWHPYLANVVNGKWEFHDAPQKSQYRLHLTLNKDFHVIGSTPPIEKGLQDNKQTVLFEGNNLSFFSLSIGKRLIKYESSLHEVNITYHALLKDKAYANRIIHLTRETLDFFLKQHGALPAMHLELAGAGLYQDLTQPGTNLLYINNRLFKVFPTLKRFHEASLAYGIYRMLWRKKRQDEPWWVIESLARIDAEIFMKSRHGKAFNLKEWLKPISFIPLIDQILYSDDLPMRQVYFKESLPPIVSEDVRFFNNPPSENPSIFYKLRSLLGDEVMDLTLSTYMRQKSTPPTSFKTVLSEISGKDIEGLIEQWLTQRTKLDFELIKVKKELFEDLHQTSITVKKNGEGIEPLQIAIKEKNGTKTRLIWDGVGNSHRFILKTKTPVKSVELDPNKLSNDPNRFNNRSPPQWKILLDQFSVDYDFQTQFLSYNAGLLFQRLYDPRNWIRFRFSHEDAGTSEHLSYTRTVKTNHLVTTGLTHTKIDTDLNSAQPGEEASFLTLAYSFVFPDIPLLPESIQRLTTTFPSFNVSITYNQQFTSGIYDNAAFFRLDMRRIRSFSNYHEIVGKIFIGQSTGRLFENSRFYLGGEHGLRGYTPLAFEGKNMSLYSVEYRFPLFYETDINFLGLAHTHTWQGALFSDAGVVTDSRNVFRFQEFRSDLGVGIRFFVDLFGVYPSIIRVDAAIPIDPPKKNEDKVHYYLSLGHSF